MYDNALYLVLVECRYVAMEWVVTLTGRRLASLDIWIDGHHGAGLVEHIAEVKPTPAFDDLAPFKAQNLHQRDRHVFAGRRQALKDAAMGGAQRHADDHTVAFGHHVFNRALRIRRPRKIGPGAA
jgi:hypothetical protein